MGKTNIRPAAIPRIPCLFLRGEGILPREIMYDGDISARTGLALAMWQAVPFVATAEI